MTEPDHSTSPAGDPARGEPAAAGPLDAVASAQIADLLDHHTHGALRKHVTTLTTRKLRDAIGDDLAAQLDALAADAAHRRVATLTDPTDAGAAAGLLGENEAEQQHTVFGSVEEFVADYLVRLYRREVLISRDQKWCPHWWRHAEAIARLEAIWRAWEHLRRDGATGMSVWFRDHADVHMRVLLDPEGPFKHCHADKGHDSVGTLAPLPHTPAPPGFFGDETRDLEPPPTGRVPAVDASVGEGSRS